MDMISGIVHLLRWLVDLVTVGYRFAHSEALAQGDGTPFEVAVATWLVGTGLTFFGLGLTAFGWYAAVGALRWRLRQLLHRGVRGLDMDRAQRLADEYVKVDRVALALQARSGVAHVPAGGAVPDSFVERGRGSRLAAGSFGVSRAVRGAVALVRVLCTSIWGWLSLGATWWAVGRPGADTVLSRLGTFDVNTWRPTSTELSVLGLVIAVATFALGRLRSVRSSGHHVWRKAEVGRAADELALREVALDEALGQLVEALPEVHRSWLIEIQDRPDAHAVRVAESEADLRGLLGLPPVPLDAGVLRGAWRGQTLLFGAEPQVKEAVDALADLRLHLEQVSERNETALRRYAPWSVVRVASRFALGSAIAKVQIYVDGPVADSLRLRDAEWYARPASVEGVGTIEICEEARRDWLDQTESAERDLRDRAHQAQLRALIGVAELRDASDKIHAYLHPTGPLRRMRDRLLPL